MKSAVGLCKPEYLLQPRRLARRILGRGPARDERGRYVLPLPWGLSMRVEHFDVVPQVIERLGIYDLIVTETLWRLIRPGDTVLDVGANIGFMTLAMAARLRDAGRVFSFEPHPEIFAELSANVDLARQRFPGVTLRLYREAASDVAGTAALHLPALFDEQRGLAHLGEGAGMAPSGRRVDVAARPLDEHASELGGTITAMKVDVEGHEAAVFRGARSLLATGAIRHIIFEEHREPPTDATEALRAHGYTLFSLERTLLGPRLGDARHRRRTTWEAPSLLATRAPDEALAACSPLGWRSLGA
jgi:FkbM family methyltransferase